MAAVWEPVLSVPLSKTIRSRYAEVAVQIAPHVVGPLRPVRPVLMERCSKALCVKTRVIVDTLILLPSPKLAKLVQVTVSLVQVKLGSALNVRILYYCLKVFAMLHVLKRCQ